MAVCFLRDSIRRICGIDRPSGSLLEQRSFSRSISSGAARTISFAEYPSSPGDDLRSRIFRLVFPKRSATTVIQKWVSEGNKAKVSDLRRISEQLRRSQRYKHALEIMAWMEAQNSSRMSPADHAVRLELIIKVHNLVEAEEYFESISDTVSQKAACLPLLRSYVKERATEKAEAFMVKLHGLGVIVNPHPYNEMMKLYMATCQFDRVLSEIQNMKQNKIPLNVLSYNLWMNACGEVSGVRSAELVYREMMNENTVKVGWSTYSTLANIYRKSGLVDKAVAALRAAEKKLSTCNRLGYSFLVTLYASLNKKDEVLRVWEASKALPGGITCANYMCILLCLVKVGDIEETERIFTEWESQCRNYDIRVSNILLGAYMRNRWVDKAELLHLRTLEKGGCPNYKTWEILMEGYVKSQNMDKAINAMKKGFSMLKHCDWRPSPSIIMTIAEGMEKQGQYEDAKHYLKVVRRLGLASLPLYKSFLRLHVRSQKPAHHILCMMEKDGIQIDNEASELIRDLREMSVAGGL